MVAILAFVPGALGLMGLGQIYQKDYNKGLTFLVLGILLMASIVTLVSGISGALGIINIILTVFTVIMFIGLYLIQAFDAIIRSLFKF